MERNSASSEGSALGKRKRDDSHETSRIPGLIPAQDLRQTSISGTQLCRRCSDIRWDRIHNWTSYRQRIDWAGIAIEQVGTYYRNVPSSTTCSLCRQLHAPWIEPFLESRDPEGWTASDLGDQITMFLHLRHLPHVNDYPTSRKVLREHDAPCHIAVVPIGRSWRYELPKHLASRGMVIVMPKEVPKPDLFVPQQVSKKFVPNMVLRWLKYCKRHKERCEPELKEVEGMKVIDCATDDLVIRKHHPGAKYVALSYVWGESVTGEIPSSALVLKEALRSQRAMHATRNPSPLGARSPLQVTQPRCDPVAKKPFAKSVLATGLKKVDRAATTSENKPAPELTKNIPLTIQDAIRVTRALGYRYLWVDKYCIDQENETEKRQQCGRMGDIYASSQITIFALGCNANYGLPGVSTRPRLEVRHRTTIGQYEFVSTMPDPHLSIEQSRWSTRGWTYQEGLFSTRRLFFTDYQVYFECNAMNCTESLRSNYSILHVQNGQRFRAYHRAGKFVCGNSNQYSHVEVSRSKANHRKIDTIRRCQYQIQQYSQRELTNNDDVLEAFAGIARFYARTTAKIFSLAGIPIPSPIAQLETIEQERLNHLSYALAWTHYIRRSDGTDPDDGSGQSWSTSEQSTLKLHGATSPQRRQGFPSWSWAGWVGQIRYRKDLPYCWTSYLSSVKIGFHDDTVEDYAWLGSFTNVCKQYLIRKLLTANVLHFDAYVLKPEKLKLWNNNPRVPGGQIPSNRVQIYLSRGFRGLTALHRQLMNGSVQCVVLGTYGEPDRALYRAIQVSDRKHPKARQRRIDLFEREEPDAIICLLVHRIEGISYRMGVLKVRLDDSLRDFTSQDWEMIEMRRLQDWGLHEKRSFVLH